VKDIRQAARWIDRVGFCLLMPHAGLPMPTLWEAIRGKPGGHPFKEWGPAGDKMWEWKDELPKRRLAFYGSVWLGKPGFIARALLPAIMKLWGCPPGSDGFRRAYREGGLSFDASRLGEALLARGAMNTYRLRHLTGIKPATFTRSLVELQKKLIIAKCGTDSRDTTWPASVVDLSARIFPKAHAELGSISFLEAREEALATLSEHSPKLTDRQVARLLRIGLEKKVQGPVS